MNLFLQSPPISVIHDAAVNYAFQQNAIPIIKELRFHNDATPRQNLRVCIQTEPAFATPLEIHLQSIDAGGAFLRAPVDLKLSHDFLATLNEKLSGWLKVDVHENATPIASHTAPIDILARNEWCGLRSLPEILAAFVLPNDPAVMDILGRAANNLREATGRSALNGYQDKSRRRAWEQVAAIHKAIASLGIRYISPPASFENTGQKIRFPSDIVAQRFGTCLDLSLLFAACCEQAGLHPLILMHEGHAYAACWLEERTLANPAGDNLQQIRKLAGEQFLVAFETTTVTHANPGTLHDSSLAAWHHLETTKIFHLALDIRRSRAARIKPLPIPGQPDHASPPSRTSQTTTSPDNGIGGIGIIDIPDSPTSAPSADSKTPSPPPLPLTRIDQWKSRLLDLSLRNRLLNFRETKTTIRLLSSSPAKMEDELASERILALHPKPKVMDADDPRHSELYTAQNKTDALNEHLRDELAAGRLHTHLDTPEHARRLTELYRSAKNSLEENGANTLYAAIGILEWREAEHSDRVLRAPLLLVPVELKRKSVIEGFTLRRIDEDTRLNVTLMEMLRQLFQKEIPGLDPLPEDESGVDVSRVFQLFREAVLDIPGWEVREEVWLGQFSFTKFLLWKDLADRLGALTKNRIVRHLVHEAGAPYPNPPDDFHPEKLDGQFHPRNIYCPRSADSSQLAAVMAAAAGHDFVLEGPPGTGKSQTITNIIAHCLATGKRVLFVAEKRAALDVVHRRLREECLAPFCLELHSNKTGKTDVLAQFRESLAATAKPCDTEWKNNAEKLHRLRANLNTYAQILHHRHPCGLSAWHCVDYLLPRKNQPASRINPAAPGGHNFTPGTTNTPPSTSGRGAEGEGLPRANTILTTTAETLDHARQLAHTLRDRAATAQPSARHPLAPITAAAWSPAWAETALDSLNALLPLAHTTAAATQDLLAWLNAPAAFLRSLQNLATLSRLAENLLAAEQVGPAFLTAPWSQTAPLLDSWDSLATTRTTLRKNLAPFDENKLLKLDLDDLHKRWRQSQQTWFLPKWLRIRHIKKQLRATDKNNTRPKTATLGETLSDALQLRHINTTLDKATPAAQLTLGPAWNDAAPSPATLRRIRTWGAQLHAGILACAGDDLHWLGSLRRQLSALLAETPDIRSPGAPLGKRLAASIDSLAALMSAFSATTAILQLRRETIDNTHDFTTGITTFVERATTAWPKIREWCLWQKTRHEALAAGLDPIIEQIETTPAADPVAHLEASFRQSLLRAIIETEPVLREFIGHHHEKLIEHFRDLDKTHAKLARQIIATTLAAKLPGDTPDPSIPKTETALLYKELGKQRRHIPVRQLLSRIPSLLPRLKPCVLMSPLSVAQYLEPSNETFDIVIFDEASQIPVWDAIGAIARGKQLIVVGDPKQLPPTNFFTTNTDTDIDTDAEPDNANNITDLESILDELLSNQVRHKRLKWHYRSRHESLITFSNRQYYNNELLTFPAPDTRHGGVHFRHLPAARYDKGKSRTNRAEAAALVAELLKRLLDPTAPVRSYGIVTFSLAQQQLIEDLLDDERRKHPEIENHFGDEPPVESEPIFVKNLENVQGDERDVIFFSICYGPDETGKVSMNFGPLNRDGGERRLNVAITRAKHEILVFSGLRADQIDLARTRARGVNDLKQFLDYAERGHRALPTAATAAPDAAPDSEFERMVADRLRAEGHEVHHQVGCSGYRVDLAIVDPKNPGRYLLGIECDGATYHRAATARDRDKLRQQILEDLGWTLHRIWSTDWWHNPADEMQKLITAINDQLARNRYAKE